MIQRWISVAFSLIILISSTSAPAGTQNIIPSTQDFSVSPGDSIEFSLSYADGSAETTGLGIKLHFDSNKLEFVGVTDMLETELSLVAPASLDSSDDDGNGDTDMKVVTAFGEITGNFLDAEDMPANLLTATFKAKADFTSDTTINLTGIEAANHTLSFTPVNVALADIVLPVFTAPATVIIEAVAALTPVTLAAPEVTDDKDGALIATADQTGPFSLGSHTIIWTATDTSGNSATANQTIIVQDTTPPSITVPADIALEATGDSTEVTLELATATDLVDGSVTTSSDAASGFAVGVHTVTWTATDASNNTATASQKITITAKAPEPETPEPETPEAETPTKKSGGGSMPLFLLPLLILLGSARRSPKLRSFSVSCALSVAVFSYAVSSESILADGFIFTPIQTATDGEYAPSLSINLEEPQPESDEVGGHPLPFADIQRIARPYKGNYACAFIDIDQQGWVDNIPEVCDQGANELLQSAVTAALKFVQPGSIPEGIYTVLYEGTGTLKFSGIARKRANGSTTINTINPDVKAFEIDVSIDDKIISDQRAGLRYQITETDVDDPIRNIRIVMPGSACEEDGIWYTMQSDCTNKATKPFAEILADDRNAILFNPDYIRELKPYKSIRVMNMIKASPAYPGHCPSRDDANYKNCLYAPITWDMRAKMDDAVWGASAITPLAERYGRGVPIEVLITLANTLKSDPWFTIPHSADDDYVTQLAQLVKEKLSPDLKPYIEYSNETWNSKFWAAEYVRQKGVEEQLSSTRGGNVFGCPSGDINDPASCNQFWAGALYTAKRSKEMFILWEDVWQADRPFVRVLAGYTPNPDQTFNMLNYQDTADYVDVFAVAPYFEGCRDRNAHPDCQDTTAVPQTINELAAAELDIDATVDGLFAITNNPSDRYGLSAMITHIENQKKEASKFNVRLFSYEGGQHFVISATNIASDEVQLTSGQIDAMRQAIQKANKDPRMKDAYLALLNGWKAAGGEEFTLYTLPQGYHRWGSFGIKDGLNAPLDESPKFDAAATFQTAQNTPWFTDVTVRKDQCTLDIDNNGVVHAFTDGLLLQRYLSGFRDDLLIEQSVSNDAARAAAGDIEEYIEACLIVFDIDGDGYTQGADGTLVLRYLLDFRGDVLIEDQLDASAYRKTAVDIEAYLLKLMGNPT